MIAADVMTPAPETVAADATAAAALALMYDLDVRHVPVVNASDEVIGMLSDRDLRQVQSPGEGALPENTPVSRIMWTDVLTVTEGTDLGEVVDLLIEHKVGALPVVDALEGTLSGIVSYVDVLRAARDFF